MVTTYWYTEKDVRMRVVSLYHGVVNGTWYIDWGRRVTRVGVCGGTMWVLHIGIISGM